MLMPNFTLEMEQCQNLVNQLRPTALAMKPKYEEELHRQEELGVLERFDTAKWAAPVVPVIKPSGAIRLCGDYKVSVNPHL